MENLKFLVLKVHEGTRQTFGWDGVEKDRQFLIFDSHIKHYLVTVQGVFHRHLDAIYFSNPFCEEYGFWDTFSVVPDSARFRHQSKRVFLCLFNSVEQLYTFMMAELLNDWDRADEILKSASPFEAVHEAW